MFEVKAIAVGFHNKLQKVGDTFFIGPETKLGSWMEYTEEGKKALDKVEAEKAKAKAEAEKAEKAKK